MNRDDIQFAISDRLCRITGIGDYSMFTYLGQRAAHRMIQAAKTLPEEEQQGFVEQQMARIAKRHPEIGDTDVREDIQHHVRGYSAYE
jgi:hypothetical protein